MLIVDTKDIFCILYRVSLTFHIDLVDLAVMNRGFDCIIVGGNFLEEIIININGMKYWSREVTYRYKYFVLPTHSLYSD